MRPATLFGAGLLLAISMPLRVFAGVAATLRVVAGRAGSSRNTTGALIPLMVGVQAWRTWLLATSAALGLQLFLAPYPARADGDDALAAAAVDGEVAHKQHMRLLFPEPTVGTQPTPPVIPQTVITSDPSGFLASFQPKGSTLTANNAFFQNLGTNGRTCFTCHEPQDGWGLSARDAKLRFALNPSDPLFRLVDGATCPSDNVSTPAAASAAYALLRNKGLIRIGLPMQSSMQFEVQSVADPYGCNTSPITGLTDPQSGTVSVYRRPLPTTNLGFLSTIMWDGRESDLFQQAIDATLTHAQGNASPTPAQQQQIVTFEGCTTADTPSQCASTPAGAGLFTAQLFDFQAGYLSANGAMGGPVALSTDVSSFFIGINDPLGLNPTGNPFSPTIFNLYNAFADSTVAAQAAIARGEQVFNSVPINITGVAGLNDVLNQPSIAGFCGTCHDTPNVGNHSLPLPLDIATGHYAPNETDANIAAGLAELDMPDVPIYLVTNCVDPQDPGRKLEFYTSDPGKGLVTGKCSDVNRIKGPILRGLAARAPYFHNGAAANLDELVNFYNKRFQMGLTDEQKEQLVAFLNSL